MYSHVTVKKVNTIKAGHVQSSSIGGGSYVKVSAGGYASSVYGGAGGLGTRVSSTTQNVVLTGSPLKQRSREMGAIRNEKEIMQNLNERLATYIDQVHSLEKANAQLELEIREWYTKNTGNLERDDNHYFQMIDDLRKQILNATMENAGILLQIDNTCLASSDFKIKFEHEQAARASAEKDIFDLRKVIDHHTILKTEIEAQIESLQEELIYLKSNHTEEINELRKLSNGAVDVALDVAPSADLGKVMEEMRTQYEQLVEKYRLEAKFLFEKKVEEWNIEVHSNTSDLEKYRRELTEYRQNVQKLEIESQAEYSKKNAADVTLENVNTQYAMQLAELQEHITNIETLLHRTRNDVSHQISEFSILLSLKSRLEVEIATYRSLLDGEAK
ncbi:keratin, type I cytoskeletal 19-like isoform X2 [Pseudophryne corroboree]|uniref:keratin, type I cytoskeletal 19-like isoform X2 n=1 Tax=Pseudophryne corroboree TaxID=495146 RepID=UPI0030816350